MNTDVDRYEVKYGAKQMLGLIRSRMRELSSDYEALCFVNTYVKDMCQHTLESQNTKMDSLSLIFMQASGTIWCDYSDILQKDTRKMLSDIIDIKLSDMR